MTDSGVSMGTSGWEVLVYSIWWGLIVLTGYISKSGCFFDNLLSVLVLTVMDLLAKVNIFLSFIWIYSLVCKFC